MPIVLLPVIGLWLLAVLLWLGDRSSGRRIDIDLILGDSEPLEGQHAAVTSLAAREVHPSRVTQSL